MQEVVFLFSLAAIWIIFAVVQDIQKREIANWLNFSLVVFALGFRFFYSLFAQNNFNFFYQGLIGFGIFFILGNVFYYGKLFAGGDAKLMIGLGPILPLTSSFSTNLRLFGFFLLAFLFVGAAYTIITSLFIGLRNFEKLKKELWKEFEKNRIGLILFLIFAITLAIIGFFTSPLVTYLSIIIFIIPYLYLYAKSVDEACMIKSLSPSKLEEGDWLYKSVHVGKSTIKATWDGLTLENIALLKKHNKKVLIRSGVPFSPVFLISFTALILLYKWVLIWNFFI